jgi:hypothetical protein
MRRIILLLTIALITVAVMAGTAEAQVGDVVDDLEIESGFDGALAPEGDVSIEASGTLEQIGFLQDAFAFAGDDVIVEGDVSPEAFEEAGFDVAALDFGGVGDIVEVEAPFPA